MIADIKLSEDEQLVSILWDKPGAPNTIASVLGVERTDLGRPSKIWLRSIVEPPFKADDAKKKHSDWQLQGEFTSCLVQQGLQNDLA